MNIFYKLIDEIQQIANSNGSHHIDTNVINQIFKCTKVVEIIRAKLVNFNRLNRAEHNWKDDGKLSPVEYYNEGIVPYCQLTKDEYNLLVDAIGIRDLDEEVGIYD